MLNFRSNFRIGNKCDRSGFDCAMVVGARQGGLSFSEAADLLGRSCTTVQSLQKMVRKTKTHPVSSNSVASNALLMRSEEKGQTGQS